jgi:hypothetical protein
MKTSGGMEVLLHTLTSELQSLTLCPVRFNPEERAFYPLYTLGGPQSTSGRCELDITCVCYSVHSIVITAIKLYRTQGSNLQFLC